MAEPNAKTMPIGFIACEVSLFVIISTPTNVTAIESHTCHDGITRRKTIISATKTGDRKTKVVANPEAI